MTDKIKFNYDNETKYLEAWQYLMRIGVSFEYDLNQLYIGLVKDNFFDPSVVARLKQYQTT